MGLIYLFFFCMWKSIFPSTICWRCCLFSIKIRTIAWSSNPISRYLSRRLGLRTPKRLALSCPLQCAYKTIHTNHQNIHCRMNNNPKYTHAVEYYSFLCLAILITWLPWENVRVTGRRHPWQILHNLPMWAGSNSETHVRRDRTLVARLCERRNGMLPVKRLMFS